MFPAVPVREGGDSGERGAVRSRSCLRQSPHILLFGANLFLLQLTRNSCPSLLYKISRIGREASGKPSFVL